jgi:hypothetical protein
VQAEPFIPPTPIQSIQQSGASNISHVSNLIGNIFESKKITKTTDLPTNAADILAQLNIKPISIAPFSLSIWRPIDGVMIVDSRNTKLALPTELLLNNILRAVFSNHPVKPQEEVLRWPMIENSFTMRTEDDARNELQTWLSVQHEIRPIRYLWLMGSNAAIYLLPRLLKYTDSLHKVITLGDSAINGLILPSLNELLQNPATKKQLFSVLRIYHSA